MSDKTETVHDTSKPCVCKVIKRSSLIWKETGRKNADNLSEYQCKVCGATAWR